MAYKFQFKQLSLLAVLLCICAFSGKQETEARRQNYNKPYVVTRWYDLRGSEEKETQTPFTDCGSDQCDLKTVEVVNCDGDTCILHPGSSATFKLSFVSKANSSSLTAKVYGIVAGIPVPFHLPQTDACSSSGIACPLVQGTTYNYSVVLPILKSYPRLSVIVKWELVDDNSKNCVCIKIPAKIR